MFQAMPDYPHIKAAVWFSHADYDDRDGKHILARPYWLDETPETIQAFKDGISKQK